MEIVDTTSRTVQFRLREEFLEPYRLKGDPFESLLARSTYLTKYCRGGVETWTDTIRRVVEGNVNLAPGVSESEAELLFHLFWTGQALPPGRGLWTGGVPGIPADARYNCWYTTLYDVDDWCWVANQLMLGGGVGVGLSDIHKLSVVEAASARFAIWCNESHPDLEEVNPEGPAFLNGSTPTYRTEDSREGWVTSLRKVLEAAYAGRDLVIDVSDVRPRGTPIKTFGGIACGPGPLSHLLRSVWQIVRGAAGRRLNSVECLDITNHIGLCIKSGNVRRSALIVLGNVDDHAFRSAKKDFEAVLSHRHTSNNSIMFTSWDQLQGFDWKALVEDNVTYGEPGIINMPLVWKTDPGAKGFNPCAEQALHDREACNLAEVFPAKFEENTDPRMAFRLVTRYCLRQRLTPLLDPKSHAVGIENMRVGVGLGGICDFDWTNETLAKWFGFCRKEADEYADYLGVNRPITVTTVKPSGCRPWYALTSTNKGILTLEELFEQHPEGQEWADMPEGFTALQSSGEGSRITKTYVNGVSRVLRLRLACGLEVESTPNHQWWVVGYHDYKLYEDPHWTRTDKIRIGDVLEVKLGVYDKRTHSDLASLNNVALKMRGDAAEIRQPSKMNPDLGWLLGYLLGDGSQSPSKYCLRSIDGNSQNLEKAQRIFFEQFGLETQIHPASEGRQVQVLEVGSRLLCHWLIRNNVWEYFANGLDSIPRVVRASSQEDIIAFVAGLIDSNGGAYGYPGKTNFVIGTKDKDFARHLQNVCWSVGLGVERSLNDGSLSFQSKKHTWLLTSNHFVDASAFEMLVRHSVKCSTVPSDSWCWKNSKDLPRVVGKVEAIEDLGEMPTFDVEVEGTHWYYAGSVKSHNTISLLNSSSPGIHAPHAPFYIRRTRIAKNDPMAMAMMEAGVPFEEDVYDKSGHTWVFEFPTKAPHTRVTSKSESVRDQFKRQASIQEWWADNAVSATLNFNPETEKEDLAACLGEFVPRLKSTSCLPKSHGYAQAPYEEIDEETFRRMYNRIDHNHPLVNGGDMEVEECAGGVCPIR